MGAQLHICIEIPEGANKEQMGRCKTEKIGMEVD